jgi:hypothetical protein
MIRPWRSIALLLALVTLAGCATAGSSGRSGGSAQRVRCLTDPGREATATTRPLFFLFCVESP